MPKFYSGLELVKRLKRLGFESVSQKGSHLKLRGRINGELRTAIVPMHKQIALGTLKSVLAQAGVTKGEVERAK